MKTLKKFANASAAKFAALALAICNLTIFSPTFAQSDMGITLTAPAVVQAVDYSNVFTAIGLVAGAVLSMAVAIRVVRWIMSLIV